jgi:hypothetical protein
MLSNFELEEISNHYDFNLTVLMKDELVNYKPENGNYIINLESSTSGDGTHWLSLIIRDKDCFYQDSFGIIPPQEVIDFCKKIPNSHLAFSEMQMQNIDSETCGFYALGIIIHLDRSKKKHIFKSAGEYVNLFLYDTTKNNKKLKSYFRNLPDSKGLKLLSKLYCQK